MEELIGTLALLKALSDKDDVEDWSYGHVSKGSRVRVCVSKPSCGWGSVDASSIGIAHKHEGNGVVRVNFPEVDDWKGKVSELEVVREAEKIKSGVRVRVKRSVKKPRYGWGVASSSSVGTVVDVKYDGKVLVHFPGDSTWKGVLGDLEVVEGGSTTPRATATATTTQRAVFCTNCGTKFLTAEQNFCGSCGAKR